MATAQQQKRHVYYSGEYVTQQKPRFATDFGSKLCIDLPLILGLNCVYIFRGVGSNRGAFDPNSRGWLWRDSAKRHVSHLLIYQAPACSTDLLTIIDLSIARHELLTIFLLSSGRWQTRAGITPALSLSGETSWLMLSHAAECGSRLACTNGIGGNCTAAGSGRSPLVCAPGFTFQR